MTRVQAHLHRGPLTRRVLLSGPADDFQRSELVRIIGSLPGVSSVRWSASDGGVPLIVEGTAAALLGFLLGLLLAYLIELRRRYNAQWKW
jgi:ABC-type xylose transport system permease subunit